MTSHVPIGQRLLRSGLIDSMQLSSALAHQRQWGGRLGEALVRLGFVSEPVLLGELARQHGVPCVEIGVRCISPEIVRLVPEKLVRARKIIPIALATESRRGPLILATSEPRNLTVLDEVAFATAKAIKPVLASEGDIEQAIRRHFGEADPRAARGAGAGTPQPPGPPRRVA